VAEKHVWLEGELIPADQARVSVFDHGLLYGDGVFEGIRAYGGRVFKLHSHLTRLFDGAGRINLKINWTPEQLAEAIRQTLAANDLPSGYVRLCVTRGVGTLGLNPYLCDRSCTFVIADSITLYPAEMYEKGMPIITAATIRNHPRALDPAVKSLNYLNNIRAKMEAIQADVPEALMLNHEGYVAECTGDNIFLVRDGVLRTPPLSAGLLPGITRACVIDLARAEGIDVVEEDLMLQQFLDADEVLLTGTAAEIVPVTRIDDHVIADGNPGSITTRLTAAFRDLLTHAPED